MGALLAASLVLGVAFVFALIATGTWREWHHGHIAPPLIGAALLGLVPEWVGWVGFAVLLDDTAQHLVNVIDPEYKSPLHLAYRHLVYNPWHRLRKR